MSVAGGWWRGLGRALVRLNGSTPRVGWYASDLAGVQRIADTWSDTRLVVSRVLEISGLERARQRAD